MEKHVLECHFLTFFRFKRFILVHLRFILVHLWFILVHLRFILVYCQSFQDHRFLKKWVLLLHELRRCGLDSLHAAWCEVASQGLCTMHPEIGDWVKRCANPERTNHVLSLDTFADMTLPTGHEALQATRHRAGPDAMLTYLVYLS